MKIDWKKKYEEAIKKVELLRGYSVEGNEKINELFPELAESEDERMMKKLFAILEWAKCYGACGFIPDEVKEIITYLEKQKENLEKEYVFRPLGGTDITIAAEQAIRRAKEGGHLVFAFNGMYIPVRHNSAKELVDEYEAYLEKQKEQKVDIDKLCKDIYQSGYNDGYQHGKEGAQKEQKSEWSEENKKNIDLIVSFCDTLVSGAWFSLSNEQLISISKTLKAIHPVKQEWSEEDEINLKMAIGKFEGTACDLEWDLEQRVIKWLKSLPKRFALPSKQEWNEEDEARFNNLCHIIKMAEGWNEVSKKAFIDWLKSFKNRSNFFSWKPSEEQMRVFFKATPVNLMPEELRIYQSLYDDIEKLM